jgi:hypothetical protein
MSQQTSVYFDAEGNEISIQDLVAEHSGGLVKDLRDQLKESKKDAKRTAEVEAELAGYKRGEAIKVAGLENLSEKQRKAIEAIHDGEWTSDALRATALDLGYAEKTEEELQLDDDLAAQGRITEAAAGGGAGNSSVITPADVADWPMDKSMRFMQKHPQEWELLKRGEEIVGVTFQ